MGPRRRLSALFAALLAAGGAAKQPWLEQEFTVLQNGTYIFNLQVGTPPQQVTVDIDYGSADLLIHAGPNPCASGCDPAALYTAFNTNDSLTYESNQSFSVAVRASDGSYAAQAWAWDDVQLAGANISQAVLAVGMPSHKSSLPSQSDTSDMRNLLGLGPRGLEASVLTVNDGVPFPTYDNLVLQLQRDNFTHSASFSVWVDPVSQTYGKLLFGAIDSSLYFGDLEPVPMVNFPNQYDDIDEPMYLGVPLDGLYLKVQNSGAAQPGPGFEGALLYSQTVGILNSRLNFTMPQPWLSALGTALGAVWSERLALYLVRCELTGSIGLEVSSSLLHAPLENFISPSAGIVDAVGNPVCVLEIELGNEVYLPNKFLQNYFMVVDYDATEIAFATPAAPTKAASIQPASATTTFTGRPSVESLLNSNIVTLWLSETMPDLVVPSSASRAYLLGGPPQPTRITGSVQLNSKLLPKATDASNKAARVNVIRAGMGSALGWLMMLL